MSAPKLPDGWVVEEESAPAKLPDGWVVEEEAPLPVAPEPPAALSPRSMSGTAMRSFGQGASMGFADELRGVSGALQELGSRGPLGRMAALTAPAIALPLAGPMALAQGASAPQLLTGSNRDLASFPEDSLIDAIVKRYRQDRDSQRSDVAAGARANPKTAMASEMAGAFTVPLSGAKTVAGRMLGYGGQGALQGVGQSNSTEDMPEKVAQSTALGLAGGAVGEGLSAVARPLVKRGAGIVGDIVQGKQGQIADDVAKEVASLQGAYGSEVQKGSRYLENVQRGVSGVPVSSAPAGISPQTQAQAIQSLHSPEAAALQTSVLENTMDALPAQSAAIERAKLTLQAAKSGAPQEVAKRTQDYFNAPIMSKEVIPRLDRLKARLGTGAIGAGVGGAGGALYGLVSGEDVGRSSMQGAAILGGGALLQPTGLLSMVRNATNSPRIQAAAVETGLRGIQGASQVAPRMGAAESARRDASKQVDPDEQDGIDAFLSGSP